MENQSAPAAPLTVDDFAAKVKEVQLAARIAALKTLQPGDIIVSGDSASTYTGVVAEVCDGGAMISLVFQSYAYWGEFRSVEARTYSAVDNIVAREFLRIHRTTEGVL